MSIALEIPVVDIAGMRTGDASTRRDIARRIRDVSASLGFVYITGAAVEHDALDRAFARSAEFFAAPDDAKLALARGTRIDAELACGYVPPGREHEDLQTPSDIKEALDVFSADGYIRDAFPGVGENALAGSGIGDHVIDDMRAFHGTCARAADDVLRAFALGFGLPENYFAVRHGHNNTLRLLHYPPVVKAPLPGQMRVGTHTDFGTLTLLFLDDGGGLEICATDGRWLAAPRIPGTILVNIGDLMARWTSGEFRSTPHRVAVPDDERAQRSRFSIAFFCEPNDDIEVAGWPSAGGRVRHRFAPVRAGDYLRSRLTTTLIAKT